jgi:thiamine-phosphate pyrophosphorylase
MWLWPSARREFTSEAIPYILFGPVFETPSKRAYGPPLGLDQLRQVTAQVKTPILALGGITLERVNPCLVAGAAGIAAIRLFQDAPSVVQRVAEIRAQFP